MREHEGETGTKIEKWKTGGRMWSVGETRPRKEQKKGTPEGEPQTGNHAGGGRSGLSGQGGDRPSREGADIRSV